MSPTKANNDADTVDTDEPDADAVNAAEAETETDDGELSAQDELDLERLDIALSTLDDESLRRGLSGVTEKQRQDLALQLNLPRATVHLGEGLAPLVRRKLRGLTPDRQHAISTILTQRVNDSAVDALGDASEDPTRADLDAVLPGLIEEYPAELIRLMFASYAISDAPVRDVMRELLETDERFALPDKPEDGPAVAEELPSFGLVATVPTKKAKADPERAELLEKRKLAKAERRAAAQRERKAKATGQASRREKLHAAKRPPTPS
jgi:hypothetical protein